MKISIIGAAGSVGAPAAFYLAVSGLAREVVLIDPRRNMAKQHAMDIGTAVSALDVSVKDGDYDELAGSDLVINAAGSPQGRIADRMEMLPANIPLILEVARHISRRCPSAIVITLTNPVDPLNYALWLAGGFDRHRVIGYSLNDSLRFRELAARAKGVAVRQVQATVIGEHGDSQVPLFSSVRIDGRPAAFSEEEKEAIRAEIPLILRRYEALQAGRTAGWTCAVGLAEITRAVLRDTREVFPCSVVLDGEYGQRNLSMSVPAVIGREGVREILEWKLAADERAGLERTARILKEAVRVVDETLS
jgi:malate dehydrogenase